MKGPLFLITFVFVLLLPSLAGCASGNASTHQRPVAVDAAVLARDAGFALTAADAGTEFASPDAFVPRIDAGASEHRLMIALNAATRAQCPAGWRIRLWLTDPPVESTRGSDLELHIPNLEYFGSWSSLTLWCDERAPQWFAWNAIDHDALGSGIFSELSLDGVDLRSLTRICEDPLAPGAGYRPVLLWEAGRRGSCPP